MKTQPANQIFVVINETLIRTIFDAFDQYNDIFWLICNEFLAD